MATYVDYSFYTSEYLGDAIAPADFARLALRASAVIDQITFNRAAAIITADDPEATVTAIQMATCAVAEVINTYGEGGTIGEKEVESERVGQRSVTYVVTESMKLSITARYHNAAKMYLWDTGLLFQGFASGEYSGETEEE